MLISLYQDEVLINVDELSFGRTLKSKYSWLPKGKSNPVINTIWKWNPIIILGLFSTGKWIWVVLPCNNSTDSFWIFLLILREYAELNWNDAKMPIKIILDNASLHITSRTKQVWSNFKMLMHFLPQYSPHLAPVELIFGAVKNKIRRMKHCLLMILENNREDNYYTDVENIKENCNSKFFEKIYRRDKEGHPWSFSELKWGENTWK